MKHIGYFLPLALILSAGTAKARVALIKAIVPKKNREIANNKLLEIRGGAGPLDPMTMAKATLAVEAVQGVVGHVAPSFMNENYNVANNPTNTWSTQGFGTGVMSLSIAVYCLLLKETSFATAFQFSLIPWILQNAGSILEKKASAAGFEEKGQWLCLVTQLISMYGATQDWADTAYKVVSVFWMLNGLFMVASPADAGKMWGIDNLQDDAVSLVRFFGYYLINSSTFYWCPCV